MFDYLEKIRQKSPATKKFIAFSVSFLMAGIIFIFWILVKVPDIWSDKSISDKVSANEPSPASALSQIFSQGFSAINNLTKPATTTETTEQATSTPNPPTSAEDLIIEATTTDHL